MGRGKAWSSERLDEMRRAYADGQTAAQFAREHPTWERRGVNRAWKRLEVDGDLTRKAGSGRKASYTPEQFEDVRALLAEQPLTSTRVVAQKVKLKNKHVARRIMQGLGKHAHKRTKHQALTARQKEKRLRWCTWVLKRLAVHRMGVRRCMGQNCATA